jgi:dienelactone hydrolase
MAIAIRTEHVVIPVDGGSMKAYLARPAQDGPHPAVIVWMEIFGVNAHIRDVTERVAREGYAGARTELLPPDRAGYRGRLRRRGHGRRHGGDGEAARRPDDRRCARRAGLAARARQCCARIGSA